MNKICLRKHYLRFFIFFSIAILSVIFFLSYFNKYIYNSKAAGIKGTKNQINTDNFVKFMEKYPFCSKWNTDRLGCDQYGDGCGYETNLDLCLPWGNTYQNFRDFIYGLDSLDRLKLLQENQEQDVFFKNKNLLLGKTCSRLSSEKLTKDDLNRNSISKSLNCGEYEKCSSTRSIFDSNKYYCEVDFNYINNHKKEYCNKYMFWNCPARANMIDFTLSGLSGERADYFLSKEKPDDYKMNLVAMLDICVVDRSLIGSNCIPTDK